VLYNPPVQRNTFLLWAGPFLVLAIGAGALVMIVRRRAKALPADAAPQEEID
jgi:cytochrome c-type biogenesis protein CcmH